MNALSLFSGIGGLDLAAEWAGFKTVAFCERDSFCQKVLAKHWPGVKIYDDVRTIETSDLPRIELLHGGYPCQPFSLAGPRRGHDDDRHMWPHMLRVVQELRPTWVVGENVRGHVTLGLDAVCDDLEAAGYEARAVVFPAISVGAHHIRERVFVVANAKGHAREFQPGERKDLRDITAINGSSWHYCGDMRGLAPGVPRVGDGIPNRVDRIKALGNAVVPQQAYPVFAAIAETYNVELSGVACKQEGRKFIGIERDPDFFSVAEQRIASTPPPSAL